MNRLSHALAALCLLALPAAALAQPRGAVKLAWDWHEGKVLEYRIVQELTQKVTGAGLDGQDSTSTTSYVVEQKVTSVDSEGVATVEQTYTSGHIVAQDADERVEYDSKNPRHKDKADHRLIKPHAAFIGKTITFTVDAEGKVHTLSGAKEILEEAFDSVSDANPLTAPLTAMFKGSVTDDSIRQGLEQQLRVASGEYVKPGQTWDVGSEQDLPAVGKLKNTSTYTLERVRQDRGKRVAALKGEGKIEQKPGSGTGGVLAQLATVELTDSDADSDVTFDLDSGHIVKSEMKLRTEFEIKLAEGLGALLGSEGGDTAIKQKIEQTATMELISVHTAKP